MNRVWCTGHDVTVPLGFRLQSSVRVTLSSLSLWLLQWQETRIDTWALSIIIYMLNSVAPSGWFISVSLTAVIVVFVSVVKCVLELVSFWLQSHRQLSQLVKEPWRRVHFQVRVQTIQQSSQTQSYTHTGVCLPPRLSSNRKMLFDFGARSGSGFLFFVGVARYHIIAIYRKEKKPSNPDFKK